MSKQQTAVEWLFQELKNALFGKSQLTSKDILDQAKEMEKEQRIKDYNAGYQDGQCNHINDAENYVNEQNYLNDGTTSI